MITDANLPDGWTAVSNSTEEDVLMGREFETRVFEHETGDGRVAISEVTEPVESDSWQFQVIGETRQGEPDETLGPFDDLDAAREAAIEFMEGF